MSPKMLYFEIAQRSDGVTGWGAAFVARPSQDAVEDYRRALSRIAIFSPTDPLAPSFDGERLLQQGLSRAIAWAMSGGPVTGAKTGDRMDLIGPAYARGPLLERCAIGDHLLDDMRDASGLDLRRGAPNLEVSRLLNDGVTSALKSFRLPRRVTLDFDCPAQSLGVLWDNNVVERRHVRAIIKEALGAEAASWIDRRSDLESTKMAEFFARGGVRAREIVQVHARKSCALAHFDVEVIEPAEIRLEERQPIFTL